MPGLCLWFMVYNFNVNFWGGGHLNYCGIQVGPSKKISDEEEGHHILQELPVKAHQPPPPLPPHERTPS